MSAPKGPARTADGSVAVPFCARPAGQLELKLIAASFNLNCRRGRLAWPAPDPARAAQPPQAASQPSAQRTGPAAPDPVRLGSGRSSERQTALNRIKLARQHLADASGLPAVLAAGWEIFELIAAIASASAGESPDMYPAFTFASGAAVSGRNALAFASSLPPLPGEAGARPAGARR